jgi:hypothetical protein
LFVERNEHFLALTPRWMSGPGADEGGAVCGTAVYLVPSMLNHSCDPNVDVLFPSNNSTMHLQARRDVAAGEQLSITYIDAATSVATRRKELQWGYGFSCQCARCVEESE